MTASLALLPLAFSATYQLDPAHTNVGFDVTHLAITTVHGQFKAFKGSFEFDEKTQTLKNLVVEIQTASVDTVSPDRDTHLKSPDFFDVAKYPTMKFTVKNPVKLTGQPVNGELTLHGKTLPVALNIKYNGSINMNGTPKVAFDANSKIDRTQFGMTWNKEISGAQKPNGLASTANKAKDMLVGNEVAININVEANQDTPKKK